MSKTKTMLLLVLIAACFMAGCHQAAPATISIGRQPINNAIQITENEQMLLNLVRLRYQDTPMFLSINSVTTIVEWEMSGSSSFQTRNPRGNNPNIFNVGVGGNYKEKPAISYSPLSGEKFVTQLMTPINSRVIMLLYHSGWNISRIFRLMLQNINGLPNAPSATGPTPQDAPKYKNFLEVVSALRELQKQNNLLLVLEKKKGDAPASMNLFIRPRAKENPEVKKLCKTLELLKEQHSFPLYSAAMRRDPEHVTIYPRSMIACMYYLSQSVEIPDDHRKKGTTTITRNPDGSEFDWRNVMGNLMAVHCSAWPPRQSYIKVRYRGYWYYIADNDVNSKSTFSLLMQMFSLQGGGEKGVAPLLTLPL